MFPVTAFPDISFRKGGSPPHQGWFASEKTARHMRPPRYIDQKQRRRQKLSPRMARKTHIRINEVNVIVVTV